MQALELRTQETLALVQQQQEEASQRRQILSQGLEDDDEDDETDAQRALAIEEVDEQSRMHDETQVSLGIVFAQLRAGRTHQEIGNVVTDQQSMALVGLPERLVGKMDQRIGDVSTTNNSASLVGCSTRVWTRQISSREVDGTASCNDEFCIFHKHSYIDLPDVFRKRKMS
jgi:hypothetical protein